MRIKSCFLLFVLIVHEVAASPISVYYEDVLAENAYMIVFRKYSEMGFNLTDLEPPELILYEKPLWTDNVPENTVAYFNWEENRIHILDSSSDYFQTANFSGNEDSCEVYLSILIHEFCHFMNHHLNPEIPRNFDESIACAVQLSALTDELRSRAVSKFCNLQYNSWKEIDLSDYIGRPEEFLIASYLFWKNRRLLMIKMIEKSHTLIQNSF